MKFSRRILLILSIASLLFVYGCSETEAENVDVDVAESNDLDNILIWDSNDVISIVPKLDPNSFTAFSFSWIDSNGTVDLYQPDSNGLCEIRFINCTPEEGWTIVWKCLAYYFQERDKQLDKWSRQW